VGQYLFTRSEGERPRRRRLRPEALPKRIEDLAEPRPPPLELRGASPVSFHHLRRGTPHELFAAEPGLQASAVRLEVQEGGSDAIALPGRVHQAGQRDGDLHPLEEDGHTAQRTGRIQGADHRLFRLGERRHVRGPVAERGGALLGGAELHGEAQRRREPEFGAEAAHYEKVKDTIDVWFDSGSTHFTVLKGSHAAETGFPADLYLEGSDQHRGWFHSSLLVSCMMNGVPPYKALLTHGFVIDLEGRKMSKSKGTGMAPQQVAGTLGAEILRLWVASGDCSGELTISGEILKRVVESYRRVRNTLRFLLANTSDFDPAGDAVPVAEMTEIDRYALALAARVQAEVAEDYRGYQFHLVVQKLQAFCAEDLGAFYLDILKDRLYTCGAKSRARRSAQTALWHISHSLLGLMAPILSFTAEEAWRVLNRGSDASVFEETWHRLPAAELDQATLDAWASVRQFRETVTKRVEEKRAAKQLGSSLEAELDIQAHGPTFDSLARLGEELRFVLITSRATVREVQGAPVFVDVTPSEHPKCGRCWHYRADVSAAGLCGRCESNLHAGGEARRHA